MTIYGIGQRWWWRWGGQYVPVPPVVGSLGVLHVIDIVVDDHQRLGVKVGRVSGRSVSTEAKHVAGDKRLDGLQVRLTVKLDFAVLKFVVHHFRVEEYNFAASAEKEDINLCKRRRRWPADVIIISH